MAFINEFDILSVESKKGANSVFQSMIQRPSDFKQTV